MQSSVTTVVNVTKFVLKQIYRIMMKNEYFVYPVDKSKQTPPSPNKLTDITFDMVSKMVLQFVTIAWRLDNFEDWHLCH